MLTKPGEVQVKDVGVFARLLEYRYEPMLITIQSYIIKKYGAVITESYRPRQGPNDLHGTIPVRALDNLELGYPESLAYRIMDDINNRWEYDHHRPGMQCVEIRKSKDGRHIHLQVHPNTQLRSYA